MRGHGVRRVLLRIFSATASSAFLMLPGRGARADGVSAGQLPPVTITAPEATPRRAGRSAKTVAKLWCAKQNRRSLEPAGRRGRQRRHAGYFIRRRRFPAAHRRQRHEHQRRGGQRAALLAARRGAGGRAGPDRHPALRRGQSQPVFPARLQPRPRHRSRHQDRRHARQHADPWPRAGLCRYQFPDSGADPVGECPQGSVLRRCRRLRLRRLRSRSTTSTSCRKTSRR